MSGTTTYLITGANRGIGKGLLETFVLRPETTVIAAVRDVVKSTQDLSAIKVGKDSKLIIVKIDSTYDTDPADAVKELKSRHNITKIDVLISNAGLMGVVAPTLATPPQEVRNQLAVNTIGPLVLMFVLFPYKIANFFFCGSPEDRRCQKSIALSS